METHIPAFSAAFKAKNKKKKRKRDSINMQRKQKLHYIVQSN